MGTAGEKTSRAETEILAGYQATIEMNDPISMIDLALLALSADTM